MRDSGWSVSVTFDEQHGYIASVAGCVALCRSSLACAARIEALLLPDERSTSCCSSMVSPSANGTVGRRRRS